MGCSNILTITGLPCSGKTTIGGLLAKKLNYKFIDLDNYIIVKYKSSIQNIFKALGEDTFRSYEKDSLNTIINTNKNQKLVLSLGGGTICFHNNLNLCLNSSTLIWLNTNISVIVKRLLDKESLTRPLFNNSNIINKINALQNDRDIFYNSAHIKINIENEQTDIVVEKIISKLSLL